MGPPPHGRQFWSRTTLPLPKVKAGLAEIAEEGELA